MTTYPLPNDFVPSDLDALDWEQLEPLYTALIERELKCAGCLEQLLLDRSELDAAASEAQANVYIRMTCHTDDENAKKAFLNFVEHVEPKLKDVSFQLDRRIVQCPFADELDQDRYGVYLRNLDADVHLFREENIPLQTEDTKLGQQYDEINGAMTVEFDGEEYTMPQMGKFLENTESLLQTGLRHKHPFQCKDIEIARSEIMEQQQRLQEMSLMLSQMEEEKQKLVMALDLVKHKEGFQPVSLVISPSGKFLSFY